MNDKHFTPEDGQAVQKIVEHLNSAHIPSLSTQEKNRIFRQAWTQTHPQESSLGLRDFWRQPAVTFGLGLALGCLVMFVGLRPRVSQAASSEPVLAVESLGSAQTYTGKAVQGLYPQLENPKLVVEKTEQKDAPRRVLYGTLDDGDVYVVWNL